MNILHWTRYMKWLTFARDMLSVLTRVRCFTLGLTVVIGNSNNFTWHNIQRVSLSHILHTTYTRARQNMCVPEKFALHNHLTSALHNHSIDSRSLLEMIFFLFTIFRCRFINWAFAQVRTALTNNLLPLPTLIIQQCTLLIWLKWKKMRLAFYRNSRGREVEKFQPTGVNETYQIAKVPWRVFIRILSKGA